MHRASSNIELRVLSLHWGFSVGGVARYGETLDQVGRCAPIKMRHVVIYDPRWQLDTTRLDRLGPVRIAIRSRLDFSWLARLEAEIDHFRPCLLLTHGFNGPLLVWLRAVWRGARVPCVCSYHGPYHPPTFWRRLAAPVLNGASETFFRRDAVSIASVADFTKRYLVGRGVPAHKIVVIHNGLEDRPRDPTARDAVRRELGLGTEDLIIGVASRLDRIKGIPFLVDAVLALMPVYPLLKLVIVGSGPMEAALRRQVAKAKYRERVRFIGFRHDAEWLLEGFDVFALPSLQESHSTGLLEAMRAGRAIVATTVGGNPESVRDGREGLLVPPTDAAALRDALCRLAADARLRERLGAAARRRFLAEFTVDRMLDQTSAWLLDSARKAFGCALEEMHPPCG